jgi:nicotinate-nucleotide pyrophosphorylase (carboxylating)
MPLPDCIDPGRFARLVELAREEDFGSQGDITAALLPMTTAQATGVWRLTARQTGRFCGRDLIPELLALLAPEVRVDPVGLKPEGADVERGTTIAQFNGRIVQMLAAERVLLYFLQRLSCIATLTHRFVEAVAGTHAKIFDTRKTTPGFRDLERYAVRVGGGHNHRLGLYDAVLIKDNHLAGVPLERLAHTLFEMFNALERLATKPNFVEVEVDSLEQLEEVFKVVGVDVVLLDNFNLADLRRAVRLRDESGLRGKVELEASGGVTLDNVRDIAQTGVERVSVGALTHSAVAFDLALDAVV